MACVTNPLNKRLVPPRKEPSLSGENLIDGVLLNEPGPWITDTGLWWRWSRFKHDPKGEYEKELLNSSPPLNDVKSSAPPEEKLDEEEKSEESPPMIDFCDDETVAVDDDDERLFKSNS